MNDARQYALWCRVAPLPGGERWHIARTLTLQIGTHFRPPYLRADLTISERRTLRGHRAAYRKGAL